MRPMRSLRQLLPLLLLAVWPAFAQQGRPADLQPLPAVPPPPPEMSSWENVVAEPQVTIRQDQREKREEYRVGGRLYMIRVTPANGAPPHYLVDNDGSGNFVATETLSPNTRPPMWVIKEF